MHRNTAWGTQRTTLCYSQVLCTALSLDLLSKFLTLSMYCVSDPPQRKPQSQSSVISKEKSEKLHPRCEKVHPVGNIPSSKVVSKRIFCPCLLVLEKYNRISWMLVYPFHIIFEEINIKTKQKKHVWIVAKAPNPNINKMHALFSRRGQLPVNQRRQL